MPNARRFSSPVKSKKGGRVSSIPSRPFSFVLVSLGAALTGVSIARGALRLCLFTPLFALSSEVTNLTNGESTPIVPLLFYAGVPAR